MRSQITITCLATFEIEEAEDDRSAHDRKEQLMLGMHLFAAEKDVARQITDYFSGKLLDGQVLTRVIFDALSARAEGE